MIDDESEGVESQGSLGHVAPSVLTNDILEEVRRSLCVIERLSRRSLVTALLDAHRRLEECEKSCKALSENNVFVRGVGDLHSRRCELAVAICRNDELGLSQNKLEKIAEIIWPKLEDITQKSTDAPSPASGQLGYY